MIRKPPFYTHLLALRACLSAPAFGLFRPRRRPLGDDPRIFVIPQLRRLGDIVLVTPVLREIKAQYPKSFVAVLVAEKTRAILEHNPHIDESILYQDYSGSGLVSKIRAGRFDYGFSFSGSPMSSYLLYLGRIPHRIKLSRKNRTLSEAFADQFASTLAVFPNHVSLVSFFLSMLRPLSINTGNRHKEVFPGPGEEKTSAFLHAAGIREEDAIVGLSLTAGNKIKEWPVKKFAELLEKIDAWQNMKYIVIGTAADKPYLDELRSLSDVPFLNASHFTLAELPSLMERFSFFISANTGPMHIADALDIPTVLINGAVDDVECVPESADFELVRPAEKIETSVTAFSDSSPENSRKAMELTSVDSVFAAFQALAARHLKK